MSEWTVILSRAADDDAAAREFEQDLLEQLQTAGRLGGGAIVTADLYHLPPAAPAWAEILGCDGPLLVLAWRHPRALYWTMHAAGIPGARADANGESDGRPIHCIDLRDQRSPQRVLEQISAVVPATENTDAPIRHLDEPTAKRWYPVLDFSRCTGCLQCPEFCLFGVYDVVEGLPVVASPGKCKPGCPACSRVCPRAAIMFPDYAAGGPIAGADTGTIEAFRIEDVDPAMLPPACATALKQKYPGLTAGRAACACSDPSACVCRDSAGSLTAACECDCNCECESVDAQLDAALEQLDAEEL